MHLLSNLNQFLLMRLRASLEESWRKRSKYLTKFEQSPILYGICCVLYILLNNNSRGQQLITKLYNTTLKLCSTLKLTKKEIIYSKLSLLNIWEYQKVSLPSLIWRRYLIKIIITVFLLKISFKKIGDRSIIKK